MLANKHGSEVWHSYHRHACIKCIYKTSNGMKYGIVTIIMLASSVYIKQAWMKLWHSYHVMLASSVYIKQAWK